MTTGTQGSQVFYRPESALDYMPRPELERLQLKRLRGVVQRAWDRVPLFRARMNERDVTPEDIRSLADAAKLPFTVKTDLRDTYPFGLFASSMREVVRLHASSGTTGKPIVVAYTQDDLEVWTSVMARALAVPGVQEGDIVQNCFNYGLFTGGLGYHYGAERLGATVIPVSGGNTDRQIMLMRDFGTTVVFSTPTYFLHVLDRAEELGVDLRKMTLRIGFFGAEPWTDEMRHRIEQAAGIKAFDLYGLSEIVGPGISVDCPYQDGLHIFEDHFYAEIIDPVTQQVLAGRRRGRTGADHAQQAGYAADPLPYARYHGHDARDVRLRPQPAANAARRPAQRRHADHPRRERVPLAGGVGAVAVRRGRPALSDHPHYRTRPRPDGGSGRSNSQDL